MYEDYIEGLIQQKKIPAAVLVVQKKGEIKFNKSYGCIKNKAGSVIQTKNTTMFDIASLTKVLATLPSILLLHQEGALNIYDSVNKYIKDFKYKDIQIHHLLQHTSGLPADLSIKNRKKDRDVFHQIIKTSVQKNSKGKVRYSDLGMILLGKLIETVSEMELDQFTQQYLFKPWKMNHTCYQPNQNLLEQIAPTETYEGKYIHGVVHDEKAFQLGGVSGSAGLFSNAMDISKFASYWIYPENQSVLTKQTMGLVHQGVLENRGLGFEVLDDGKRELSCGNLWSRGSFGHTGFTGTSLWIDPQEKLSVVFLTNIVKYGRNHQMSKFRKELHTQIYKECVK